MGFSAVHFRAFFLFLWEGAVGVHLGLLSWCSKGVSCRHRVPRSGGGGFRGWCVIILVLS